MLKYSDFMYDFMYDLCTCGLLRFDEIFMYNDFPLQVIWKPKLCMFWENEDVASKLFRIIDLFAW